ncbi:MAG: hypothetical protein O7C59_04440 [Rickettsia endosymbiont of Ixodes persulcatus]|nr:hypothetical protein [Rickettsia endosymbiont of Ixodes persulcatus]
MKEFKITPEQKIKAQKELYQKMETAWGETFRTSLTPFLLPEKQAKALFKKCELLISAMGKLIGHYRVNREMREYFKEYDEIKDIIIESEANNDKICIARIDLAMDEHKNFKLMEVNTQYPVVYLQNMLRILHGELDIVQEFLLDFEIVPQKSDNKQYFVDKVKDYVVKNTHVKSFKDIACASYKKILYPLFNEDSRENGYKAIFDENFLQNMKVVDGALYLSEHEYQVLLLAIAEDRGEYLSRKHIDENVASVFKSKKLRI